MMYNNSVLPMCFKIVGFTYNYSWAGNFTAVTIVYFDT